MARTYQWQQCSISNNSTFRNFTIKIIAKSPINHKQLLLAVNVAFMELLPPTMSNDNNVLYHQTTPPGLHGLCAEQQHLMLFPLGGTQNQTKPKPNRSQPQVHPLKTRIKSCLYSKHRRNPPKYHY